jgi:DNA-binding NtrC family response regulator
MESILLCLVINDFTRMTQQRVRKTTAVFPEMRMDDKRLKDSTNTPAILVAELELNSRTSLSELLRDEGYRVVEAANSSLAVKQLSQEPQIKVILTDLEMPSWTSIIKHARANLPESFILGMVRYGALPNAHEAERLGAHAYLIKPLSFNEVNQWIQRFLTGQSQINR